MALNKRDLERMNDLIEKGATISDIASNFKQYGYLKIYWEVEGYSLLGKKRSITNRLNKLQKSLKNENQQNLINEIKYLVNNIYYTSKRNGKKLIDITKIITK